MTNLKTFIVLLFAVFSTQGLALYEDSRISESLNLDAILLVPSPSPEPYDIIADHQPSFCTFCAFYTERWYRWWSPDSFFKKIAQFEEFKLLKEGLKNMP